MSLFKTPSQLTDEEWQKMRADRATCSVEELARRFGVKAASLSSALIARGIKRGTVEAGAVPETATLGENLQERVAHDRKVSQLTAQADHYRRLYAAAIQEGSTMDTLTDLIKRTLETLPTLT